MANDPTVNGVKFHGDDRADGRGLDQYTKLAGALTATPGSVALTATIGTIRGSDVNRRGCSIENIGNNDAEIGVASNFTTARWLLTPGNGITVEYTGVIYGKSTAGTTVQFWDEGS